MVVWLFDIDGTLILSRGAGQEATWFAMERAFGCTRSTVEITFAGRTDRAIAADLFRAHGVPQTDANWEHFRSYYLDELEARLPGRVGQVLPGVRQLLTRLQLESDSHLGLLTGNIRAGAAAKLKHFGLWRHFRFGGFGDTHESRDDVAAEALDAARACVAKNLSPTDVWVIGDTVHDVSCARAIGAHCIAVATGGATRDELAGAAPDILVDNLEWNSELASLVDRLS